MMTVHPYAELFPMMSDAELAGLVVSLKENGFDPTYRIITDQHGHLIDGRNRLKACEASGVEPSFETRHFEDDAAVLRFVILANDVRRHLNESQRAMVAAGIANLKDGQKKSASPIGEASISRKQAAEMLNVGTSSIDRAKQVISNGVPELQQAVKQGEISVNKAAVIARKPIEEQQEEVAKAKERREPKRPREQQQEPAPAGQVNGVIKPLGVGIVRANEAINSLKRIPKNDALRQSAFKLVRDWMRRNK